VFAAQEQARALEETGGRTKQRSEGDYDKKLNALLEQHPDLKAFLEDPSNFKGGSSGIEPALMKGNALLENLEQATGVKYDVLTREGMPWKNTGDGQFKLEAVPHERIQAALERGLPVPFSANGHEQLITDCITKDGKTYYVVHDPMSGVTSKMPAELFDHSPFYKLATLMLPAEAPRPGEPAAHGGGEHEAPLRLEKVTPQPDGTELRKYSDGTTEIVDPSAPLRAGAQPGSGHEHADSTLAGGLPTAHTDVATPGANVPVGAPVASEEAGHEILKRLAAGDRTALEDLGVRVPPDFDPRTREWGLGITAEGVVIVVKGERGAVDWGNLPGVEPRAHSHPFNDDPRNGYVNALKGKAATGARVEEIFNGNENEGNRIHLLPSAADIRFCAVGNIEGHEVHTPFVHLGGGVVANPRPGVDAPTVTFEIVAPHAVGPVKFAPDIPVYQAYLIARDSNGSIVWSGLVYSTEIGGFSVITNKPHEILGAGPAPARPGGAGGSGGVGGSTPAGHVGGVTEESRAFWSERVPEEQRERFHALLDEEKARPAETGKQKEPTQLKEAVPLAGGGEIRFYEDGAPRLVSSEQLADEAWMADLERKLSPAARAELEAMRGEQSATAFREKLSKIPKAPDELFEGKATETATKTRAAAASKARASKVRDELERSGFFDRPEIQKLLANGDLEGIRGRIAEELSARAARERFTGPNDVVLQNVNVMELQPGYTSAAEFKAATKYGGTAIERDGLVYAAVTDMDTVVVDGTTGKVKYVESVKSGKRDTINAANQQTVDARDAIARGQANPGTVWLRAADGSDITVSYDWPSIATAETANRGPLRPGVAWDHNLDMTPEDMEELIRAHRRAQR
jgi:hypothetical protein